FKSQYDLDVAGNLFVPNELNRSSTHAAVVVGHPMGATKEQSANLYATKMAEQGFVTLSIDLPFWGESEGRPRKLVSPDLYVEAAQQRYVEFAGGATKYTSGTVHEITQKSSSIEREFYDFYRTPRGEYTPPGQSPLLTTHPTLSSNTRFMNFYPFNDIETISP